MFGEDEGFGLGVAVGGNGASAVQGGAGEFSQVWKSGVRAGGESFGWRHFWGHCGIVVVVNWECSSSGS